MEKPYFGMGDASHPVNIWQWKSGTTGTRESIALLNARGLKDIEKRDTDAAGIQAQGLYHEGTWRVVMKRSLATAEPEKDVQFVEGRFIPLAFAAWDGSNSEKGSKHTMTTWYWLLLKPPAGPKPFVAALVVIVLLGVGELLWVRTASRRP
jgi:DMSO reductase family type II enzyme heme b subunit